MDLNLEEAKSFDRCLFDYYFLVRNRTPDQKKISWTEVLGEIKSRGVGESFFNHAADALRQAAVSGIVPSFDSYFEARS
jgi:hypothetical protein